MGCFDECLGSMMEPYGGNMPLFKGDQTDATVTIVQESSDDGMTVTRISTPPRTETSSLLEAIDQILGLFCPMMDKDGQKPSNASDKEKGDNNDSGEQLSSSFGSEDKRESDGSGDDDSGRPEDKNTDMAKRGA